MPIPSQNEILIPFLEILRDGQPHTRSQIIFDLAKRFNLTEDELNDMRWTPIYGYQSSRMV